MCAHTMKKKIQLHNTPKYYCLRYCLWVCLVPTRWHIIVIVRRSFYSYTFIVNNLSYASSSISGEAMSEIQIKLTHYNSRSLDFNTPSSRDETCAQTLKCASSTFDKLWIVWTCKEMVLCVLWKTRWSWQHQFKKNIALLSKGNSSPSHSLFE